MDIIRYNDFMSHSQPKAIIIGGPNGAGKTTLALEYQKIHPFVYLGADAMAYELNAAAPESVKIQAGRLFTQRITQHMTAQDDLIIEATLSGKGFHRVIERLNAAGYHTVLSFVFLANPESCIARVAERRLKGGHYVPPEDVKRRYYRAIENFWNIYKPLVNKWHLYANINAEFQLVCTNNNTDYDNINQELLTLFLNELKKVTHE